MGHDSRERVLAHLATCCKCKAEADAQRRLKSVFAEAAPPPLSEGFLARLQNLPGTGPDGDSEGRPGALDPDGRWDASRGPGRPGGSAFGESFTLTPAAVAPHRDRSHRDRGFRVHAVPDAPRGFRGRRFAFAAAGAVSLAAFALGGAQPLASVAEARARAPRTPAPRPARSPAPPAAVSVTTAASSRWASPPRPGRRRPRPVSLRPPASPCCAPPPPHRCRRRPVPPSPPPVRPRPAARADTAREDLVEFQVGRGSLGRCRAPSGRTVGRRWTRGRRGLQGPGRTGGAGLPPHAKRRRRRTRRRAAPPPVKGSGRRPRRPPPNPPRCRCTPPIRTARRRTAARAPGPRPLRSSAR
ncbi:hypothetical protein [Streptomyces eurocidicus]|uniref:hypothetical protein n=1 Tax=Streptomyces eurocidicus TaxID=66423 RepID=UPI003CC822FC